MIFDEQKYSSLLGSIDLSEYKIKKISNYMTYFVDNANSICKIWKNFFYFTKSNETKLALIYLLNDVFEDSASKKNNAKSSRKKKKSNNNSKKVYLKMRNMSNKCLNNNYC